MALSQVPSCTDLQLFERVVLRETDAFNEVYRRHARSVAATAKMVLGSSPACEDVVSEVFLAWWLTPESFIPDRGSLLGFLRMKARGRSIDVVRCDVARRRRERKESFDGDRLVRQPDEDVLKSGVAQKVHEALATLNEREREPIKLAFFTGMTYKDVARHLDLPEGTVKARIRSGLQNARFAFSAELLADVEG